MRIRGILSLFIASPLRSSIHSMLCETSKNNTKALVSFDNGLVIVDKMNATKHERLNRNKYILLEKKGDKFITLDFSKPKLTDLSNTGVWSIGDLTIKNLQLPVPEKYDFLGDPNKKLIIFIRHCESLGNALNNYNIVDPELTPKGLEQGLKLNTQMKAVCRSLKRLNLKPELAIVSPLTRTTQTALIGLKGVDLKKEGSILCTEVVENNSCKRASFNLADYSKKFPEVNFQKYEYEYWAKKLWRMDEIETQEEVDYRCKLFSNFLSSKDDKVIIVVTHSIFIREYFKSILGITEINCNYTNKNTKSYPVITQTENAEIIPVIQTFQKSEI